MRKSREIYINAEYHVTARINRGEFILESAEIKELFLFIVCRAKKKYSFRLRNFVVMSNHIHFLLKPGKVIWGRRIKLKNPGMITFHLEICAAEMIALGI